MNRVWAAIAALSCVAPALAETEAETTAQILALERRAMDGWQTGNPDPALASSDSDITWFHVVTEKRIDGLTALKDVYERYRGMALFDSYEMVAPRVQFAGDVAILSYQFLYRRGEAASRWNVTEVYRRTKEGWRVIHSHFSQTRTDRP